jgi:hypothetical protein
MESVKIPQFKDFVVTKHSYHVNEKLKGVGTIPRLSTDKMHINGELKIVGIDRSSSSHTQYVRIELPTGDAISIPASDHPRIEYNGCNFPVFIDDGPELRWNKDLVAGEFYIMLNRFGEKKLIFIKYIYNEKIEYASCTSRYDRNNSVYFVESIAHELMIVYAKDDKFISLKDLMC